MAYKISGIVLKKFEPQTLPSKSGNLYTKQDLVIVVRKFDPNTGEPTLDDSNTPKFSFFGERINDLLPINEGDIVTIHFDITGRSLVKEDGKTEYFNDIRPLRVDKIQSIVSKCVQENLVQNNTPVSETNNTDTLKESKVKENDLPF